MPQCTPKTFKCLLQFFKFFRVLTAETVGRIFKFNTSLSFDAVLCKEVRFGLENLNLKFN